MVSCNIIILKELDEIDKYIYIIYFIVIINIHNDIIKTKIKNE